MKIPTVKIKHDNDDGFCIINEADFDTDMHEMFEGEAESSGGELTRESLAKMKKNDVIEILEAHDAVFDKSAGAAELRELADRVVFVDLGDD